MTGGVYIIFGGRMVLRIGSSVDALSRVQDVLRDLRSNLTYREAQNRNMQVEEEREICAHCRTAVWGKTEEYRELEEKNKRIAIQVGLIEDKSIAALGMERVHLEGLLIWAVRPVLNNYEAEASKLSGRHGVFPEPE